MPEGLPTNKSHIDKLVPEFLIGTHSQKLKDAQTFKDSITKTAYNAGLVLLLGSFERIVLAKYQTALGSARNILKDHKGERFDYYDSRERFISTIDRLSQIIDLIKGFVENSLTEKLDQIKSRRNQIAHGTAISMTTPTDYSLEEIAKILDEIIAQIESK